MPTGPQNSPAVPQTGYYNVTGNGAIGLGAPLDPPAAITE